METYEKISSTSMASYGFEVSITSSGSFRLEIVGAIFLDRFIFFEEEVASFFRTVKESLFCQHSVSINQKFPHFSENYIRFLRSAIMAISLHRTITSVTLSVTGVVMVRSLNEWV
ncbi:hypothetical protein CEXT_95611 [Caerostris extrusa]|uniref:Uncharacterized protein n=1 Tax=Caerostris extrusa TaxID=172846 RepID=A0AAV4T0K0_CAEEX|nr:hypothetical protein CEXT_95611 [Caerostris extrusa]